MLSKKYIFLKTGKWNNELYVSLADFKTPRALKIELPFTESLLMKILYENLSILLNYWKTENMKSFRCVLFLHIKMFI